LYLKSIGTDNSILLSSYLLLDQRYVQCNTLIDSGCSAVGFLDEAFATAYQVPVHQLSQPRPLHLADGALASNVTHFAPVTLRTGHHYEVVSLYITKLSKANPVILGLPWLRNHNPEVDWETATLRFGDKCAGRCFAQNLPLSLRTAPKV